MNTYSSKPITSRGDNRKQHPKEKSLGQLFTIGSCGRQLLLHSWQFSCGICLTDATKNDTTGCRDGEGLNGAWFFALGLSGGSMHCLEISLLCPTK
jgi:hypothetical protein